MSQPHELPPDPQPDPSLSVEAEREALAAVRRRIAAQNAELEQAATALARMPPSFAFADAARELSDGLGGLDGVAARADDAPAYPPFRAAVPILGTRC
jgi:hypothetical protein